MARALNVEPGVKPVIQPMWTFHPNIEAQIIKEVQKLIEAPCMDMLIDLAAGYAIFSFMDGFSNYNWIRMSPKDVT